MLGNLPQNFSFVEVFFIAEALKLMISVLFFYASTNFHAFNLKSDLQYTNCSVYDTIVLLLSEIQFM